MEYIYLSNIFNNYRIIKKSRKGKNVFKIMKMLKNGYTLCLIHSYKLKLNVDEKFIGRHYKELVLV